MAEEPKRTAAEEQFVEAPGPPGETSKRPEPARLTIWTGDGWMWSIKAPPAELRRIAARCRPILGEAAGNQPANATLELSVGLGFPVAGVSFMPPTSPRLGLYITNGVVTIRTAKITAICLSPPLDELLPGEQ